MGNRICIHGLGYVGLPLALAFSQHFEVVGFDIDGQRINELNRNEDRTKETTFDQLKKGFNNGIKYTHNPKDTKACNVHIVTVPTPIDREKQPDLSALLASSKMIGEHLKYGDLVIYESTVYPGVTEDVCVPQLEANSGLVYNKDFFAGYSPERINPGDRQRALTSIRKITSGSTPEVATKVDDLYSKIITAGTYKAKSIKIAEAAKVIENIQRDVNIALINEFSKIFHSMNLDTEEVLSAAATKWNFMKFRPGLVGGHCIGIDPYYLAHKSRSLGYEPQVIMSARELNDQMGHYVAERVMNLMMSKPIKSKEHRVLILGFTFKENCSDIRNTKVIDIFNYFYERGVFVDVYDPLADKSDVKKEHNIEMLNDYKLANYTTVILAVAHEQFKRIKRTNPDQVIFDVKSFLEYSDDRL